MDFKTLILEELAKHFVDEDYPVAFNHEEFAKLRSFAERVRYCEANLQKIAAGSSRIVYKIDDNMVLKLAKNAKGIAQDRLEAQLGNDSYVSNIVAKIFNSDPADQWIEMELAKKLTPTRFKQLTGCDIRQLELYLRNRESGHKNGKSIFSQDEEVINYYDNNEFSKDIVDFMFNYNMPAGDLGRLSSYGEVNREGHSTVVVTDYGLDQEVYNTYYDRSKKVNLQPRW